MRFLLRVTPLILIPCLTAQVPRSWDDKALANWATPLAGINVRPGLFTEADYYKAPVDNLRTYPVYYPGREPAGYWEMLNKVGPKPLVELSGPKSKADWLAAGRRVFEEYDFPEFRTGDARMISAVRGPKQYEREKYQPRADGTVRGLRWIPTVSGIQIGLSNCAGCHTRLLPDGTLLPGAPANEQDPPFLGTIAKGALAPVPIPGESPMQLGHRAYRVPWIKDDVHEAFSTMSPDQYFPIFGASLIPGIIPRWNGSPFYPTKIVDLVGISERKYIDHTGTHLNRGIADIMRYAALVTYSDISDFGEHHMLPDAQRRVPLRLPDEALYALAVYLTSLQPPVNHNPVDANAKAGQKLFNREGCSGCHTAPLYTNNRLTLAAGFVPSLDLPSTLDVMKISVGTDPSLALKTRKGTGFYKVPSLKGVWYRGRYLHDGSLSTLEEMFDPKRTKEDFVRTGFSGVNNQHHAVPGHEFGLKLNVEERTQLISFLRTL